MNPFGQIVGWLGSAFEAAAGWAWDTVVNGLTDWIARGVMAMIMALWNFMDTASSPDPTAEWFSGDYVPGATAGAMSPFAIAAQIGVVMAGILVLLGIIRGVANGSPGAVFQVVGRDLPLAAFGTVSIIVLSKAAIDLADGMSYFIWEQTSASTENAMGNLVDVMIASSGGSLFIVGPILGLFLIVAMMFMWVVLFVRESLIYVVIVYAVAFGFPSMLFPPLRETSKKVLELLVALIIAKPVMVLALSVGLSALGGIGATGEPGDGVGTNFAKELGTLIVGVVVFGMAAFMPYLTWKLMPVVAAAVIAQGVASSPIRAGTQAAQLQYYGSNAMKRLSGGGGQQGKGDAGAGKPTDTGAGASPGGGAGPAGGGGADLAGGTAGGAGGGMAGAGAGAGGGMAGAGAAGGGGAASSAAAAPAAGPAAPVVIAAAAAKSTADAVKQTATTTADAATSSTPAPTPPPSGGPDRDVSGGS